MAKRKDVPAAMAYGFMPMEPVDPPHGGYADGNSGFETCDALEQREPEHAPTRRAADTGAYAPMHQNRTQIPVNGREMYSERTPSIEDGVAFSEAIRADLEPS